MSVTLIVVIALVIAIVTGVKIYLDSQEINKEKSTTFTAPVQELPKEEIITVNQPVAAPQVNPVKEPITDKTVDAPKAPAPTLKNVGKKPNKKRYFKPKTKQAPK